MRELFRLAYIVRQCEGRGGIKADILAREFPSHTEIFCNKEQLYVGDGVGGVGAEEGKDMIQFVFSGNTLKSL